jgi:hypothetical protein
MVMAHVPKSAGLLALCQSANLPELAAAADPSSGAPTAVTMLLDDYAGRFSAVLAAAIAANSGNPSVGLLSGVKSGFDAQAAIAAT